MALPQPARRRRSPAQDDDGGQPATRPARRSGTGRRHGVPGAATAMRAAVEQLAVLLGRRPESVSSLRPTEEGWEAVVEVLELERIPDTTSVMGSYTVTLDEEGELISYERTRRYSRGMIDRPDG
ncbi:gas vesicle protein [Streptomyces sp. NPDC046866]|uniref:gas vesicle protein GvpO n=1 Tax=Streptomyces sp. NPDC046866 TaxID=3154921 RepID=UPI003454D4A4